VCQKFGKFAAKSHESRSFGGLDIINLMLESDGTLKHMISIGRGRLQEELPSIYQRTTDIAAVRNQLSSPYEWEAFKNGYRLGATQVAEAACLLWINERLNSQLILAVGNHYPRERHWGQIRR